MSVVTPSCSVAPGIRAVPLASTRHANTGPGPVATTPIRTSRDEAVDDARLWRAAAEDFFFDDDNDAVVRAGTGVVVVRLVCVSDEAESPPSPPAPRPSRYSAPTSRTMITPTTRATGIPRGSRGGRSGPPARPPRPGPAGAPSGITRG